MTERLHVLLVENNPADVRLIRELLATDGESRFEIKCVQRLSDAIELARQGPFYIILLNLELPDSSGLETLRAMRRADTDIPIVVLTGNDDERMGLAAIQEGAQDYIMKGHMSDQVSGLLLARVLCYALGRHMAMERLLKAKEEWERTFNAERENLESQLRQAQKMEAVGQLAGGIAHDFNNMLAVINGHSQMLLKEIASSNPMYDSVMEIRKAGQRSADLTHQLLAFARKQPISMKELNIADSIESMLNMLHRLLGENIELQWKPAAKLWTVKMDSSHLDQILTNLLINARDAVADGGKVTIETYNSKLDPAYCKAHIEFVPGEYVVLSVGDNGCGMDKETISHLFDPFFTTKKTENGTGLGLSTVFGIVKQNNGCINVYSEIGLGSTFKIYLPRYKSENKETDETPGSSEILRGNETILLVEDEASLLCLTKMQLEHMGYAVLAADSPAKAIKLAKEDEGDIHLLMTDVVLPGMNGQDLGKRITAMRPKIKCLFMSGYTSHVMANSGILDKGINFIEKPFTEEGLSATLRKVLCDCKKKNSPASSFHPCCG